MNVSEQLATSAYELGVTRSINAAVESLFENIIDIPLKYQANLSLKFKKAVDSRFDDLIAKGYKNKEAE